MMKSNRRNKKNNGYRNIAIMALTVSTCSLLTLTGCSQSLSDTASESASTTATTISSSAATNAGSATTSVSGSKTTQTTIDTSALFSDRDLSQTANLSNAAYYTVTDGTDIHITEAGVYVLSGTAKNVTIYVEADSDDKVQLVLDGLNITNEDFPCIYVAKADKVFVTTDSDSTLSVTGSFKKDGDTNTDGVIFSRSDLVLNGTGALTVSSTDNGIVCKDDLKVTGGTYQITAASKAFEANDSILIFDGTFHLKAGTDGLHAENDEDDTLGYIYINGGTFNITAGDDGIHALSVLQIDNGTINITAAEGLEGTYIQINGGTITIQASDDGINAAKKSNSYRPTVEFNGGDVSITMGAGDTDGVDSNGDIIINGGTINVTGNSTFDYDGTAEFNGGTIIVNGQETDTIPNQMMGGGMGGFGGRGGNGNMDGNGSFGGKGNHQQR